MSLNSSVAYNTLRGMNPEELSEFLRNTADKLDVAGLSDAAKKELKKAKKEAKRFLEDRNSRLEKEEKNMTTKYEISAGSLGTFRFKSEKSFWRTPSGYIITGTAAVGLCVVLVVAGYLIVQKLGIAMPGAVAAE